MHAAPAPSARYADILACYLSEQISPAQWREHLKDEVFRAWLAQEQKRKA